MARQARTRQTIKEEIKKLLLFMCVIVLGITMLFNLQVKTIKIAVNQTPSIQNEIHKVQQEHHAHKGPKYASK